MKTRSSFRRFLNKSIVRLIILVIIVILPINVLTLLMSDITIREVEKQVTAEAQNELYISASLIDAILSRMKTRLNYMSTNNIDFIRLNMKPAETSSDRSDDLQAIVSLRNSINDILVDYSWIQNAYAYFPNKDLFLLSGNSTQDYQEATAFVQNMISNESPDRLFQWTVSPLGDRELLVLLYKNRNAYYGAWVDLEALLQELSLNREGSDNIIFFANQSYTLATGDDAPLETDFSVASNVKFNGKNYLPVVGYSEQSDLILVELLSKSRMALSLPFWLRILQGISLLALLVIPIMLFFMRRWIIHPIRSLTRAMAAIEKGNMDYRIEEKSHGSEFDRINNNFNQMMDQVKSLKIDIYENQLDKQNIKMRYLTQQIQPHFILNAMNILYSYEPEEFNLIHKMIQCLSKYFRYIVKADANFVRLEQELDHIKNYFEIQQARYPDTFSYRVECEKDIGKCLVPPLLVQNFAENAIKYSLIIGSPIEISVTAQKTDRDKIKILVTDTGEGLPDEIISKIETFRQTREYQNGLGIGTQNSIERLDILYGGQTELKFIQNEDPQGTTIEITVPNYEDPASLPEN